MSKSQKWYNPNDAKTKDMTPLVIQFKPTQKYQNTLLQQIMEKPYKPPSLLPPEENKERCSLCNTTLTKPESIERKLCLVCFQKSQKSSNSQTHTHSTPPALTQISRTLPKSPNSNNKPKSKTTESKALYITKQITKNEKDQMRCPMCKVTPSSTKRKTGTLCDYCKKTFLKKRKMFCRDCRDSLVNASTFHLCLCLSSYCVECVKKDPILKCDCTSHNLIEFNKV